VEGACRAYIDTIFEPETGACGMRKIQRGTPL